MTLQSVATLEAHESESGVETTCYEYKRNTIKVILEWFLTTRSAATTPRISIFTLSLLKISKENKEILFPIRFPYFSKMKKISKKSFHSCKLQPWESSSLESEQNRTKLKYWKIPANEKFIGEIGEVSSVKKIFWANHTSEKTQSNLKRKIFWWTKVPEKFNRLYSVILEK